jgi:ATP-dependent Clp protease ATP-binding subunit ClpA
MFERFTDRARQVLVHAQQEAHLLNHDFIGTEHLLLGLIDERDGVAGRALAAMDITIDRARSKVEEIIGPKERDPETSPPFTPRAKKALELSLREALQLGHNYIGTEHMLLGVVREGEGVALQVLRELGADPDAVREAVLGLISPDAVRAVAQLESDEPGKGDLTSGPRPFCPRCHASIELVARFRRMQIEPEGGADGGEPLSVEVVSCGQCGTALHMFRLDEQ